MAFDAIVEADGRRGRERNFEETAKTLARAIKDSDVYKSWLQAQENLNERHAARVMLRDLQRAQAELMRKVQTGEPVTPEDEAHWQRTVETVAYNPYVAAVLQAEQALARLLAEINEIIAAELDLGTQDPDGPSDGEEGKGGPPPPRSRLWVPGHP